VVSSQFEAWHAAEKVLWVVILSEAKDLYWLVFEEVLQMLRSA
jgi:hypothetical protein